MDTLNPPTSAQRVGGATAYGATIVATLIWLPGLFDFGQQRFMLAEAKEERIAEQRAALDHVGVLNDRRSLFLLSA